MTRKKGTPRTQRASHATSELPTDEPAVAESSQQDPPIATSRCHGQPVLPSTTNSTASKLRLKFARLHTWQILRRGRRMTGHILSSGIAIWLIICIIVVELGFLGLGLSRRWTQMGQDMIRVQQLKLEEAQILAAAAEAQRLNPSTHASAASTTATITLPDKGTTTANGDNPLLQARDVNTILEQEDMEDMLNKLAAEDEKRLAEAIAKQQASETAQANAAAPSADPAIKKEEDFQRLCRDGISALIAGDMRRCILSLSQAAVIHPDDPALLYYHGLAYDKLLNPKKAQEYYMALFNMRDAAGEYFQKASKRLTFGFANPQAMRGKLAFGPHLSRIDYQVERGESVELVFPILLAPNEDLRPEDVYIHIQFFDLTKGGDIQISHHEPTMTWESQTPTWQTGEERLLVHYTIPVPTQEQLDAFGEMKYYGFTAKLYYRGEPLDCISSPASLILREYQLRDAQNKQQHPGDYSLLPEDDIFPSEAPAPAQPAGNPNFILQGAGTDGLVPE